jgi:ankyrin repeat protein
VKLLVEHGADVNAADKNNRTPLKMAKIGNHTEVATFLEEHGAEE